MVSKTTSYIGKLSLAIMLLIAPCTFAYATSVTYVDQASVTGSPIVLNNNETFFMGPGVFWVPGGQHVTVNGAPVTITLSPGSLLGTTILISSSSSNGLVTIDNEGTLSANPSLQMDTNNSDVTVNNMVNAKILGAISTGQQTYTFNLYQDSSINNITATSFGTNGKQGAVINMFGDATTGELTNINIINIKNSGTQFTTTSPASFKTMTMEGGTALTVKSTVTSSSNISGTNNFTINVDSGGTLNANVITLGAGTLNMRGGTLNSNVVGAGGSTIDIQASTTLGADTSTNGVETLNISGGDLTLDSKQAVPGQWNANTWNVSASRTLNIKGDVTVSGNQLVNNGTVVIDQYAAFMLLNPVYSTAAGGGLANSNAFRVNSKSFVDALIIPLLNGGGFVANQQHVLNVFNYMTNTSPYTTLVTAEAHGPNISLSSPNTFTLSTNGASFPSNGLSFGNFVLSDGISKTLTVTPKSPTVNFQEITNNGTMTMNIGNLNSAIINNGTLNLNGGVMTGNLTNNNNKVVTLKTQLTGDVNNSGIFHIQNGTVQGAVTNTASGTVNMGTVSTTTDMITGAVDNSGIFHMNKGTIQGLITNSGTFNVTNSGCTLAEDVVNTGTFNLSAGNINDTVTNNTPGVFNHSGGSITSTVTNSGTYHLTGGTITGVTTNTGVLNLTSGTLAAITNNGTVNLFPGTLTFGDITATDPNANSILNVRLDIASLPAFTQAISDVKQINVGALLPTGNITVHFNNKTKGFNQFTVEKTASFVIGFTNATSSLVAANGGVIINNGAFTGSQGTIQSNITNNKNLTLNGSFPNTLKLIGNVTNQSGATFTMLSGQMTGDVNNSGTFNLNDANAVLIGTLNNTGTATLTQGSLGSVNNGGILNIEGAVTVGTITGSNANSVVNIKDAFTVVNPITNVAQINLQPSSAKTITMNAAISGFNQFTVNNFTTFNINNTLTAATNGTLTNSGNLTLNTGKTINALFTNSGTATIKGPLIQAFTNTGTATLQEGSTTSSVTNSGTLTIDGTTAGGVVVAAITNNSGGTVDVKKGTINALTNNGTVTLLDSAALLPMSINSTQPNAVFNINTPFILNSTVTNTQQINIAPLNVADIVTFQKTVSGFNQIQVNNGVLKLEADATANPNGNITLANGANLQLNAGNFTVTILGTGIVDINGGNLNSAINLSNTNSAINVNMNFTAPAILNAENITVAANQAFGMTQHVTAATAFTNNGTVNLNGGTLTATTVTGTGSATNGIFNLNGGSIVGNISKTFVNTTDLLSLNVKSNFATQGAISGKGVKVAVDSGKTLTLNNQADIYNLTNNGTVVVKSNIDAQSTITNNGTLQISDARTIKSLTPLITDANSNLAFSLFSAMPVNYDRVILDFPGTTTLNGKVTVSLSSNGNNIAHNDSFTILETPTTGQPLNISNVNFILPDLPLIGFSKSQITPNSVTVTATRKPYQAFATDPVTTSIGTVLTDVRAGGGASSDFQYALGQIDGLTNPKDIQNALSQLQPETHNGTVAGSYLAQTQPMEKIAYRLDLLRTGSDAMDIDSSSGYASGDPLESNYTVGPLFFGTLATQRTTPSKQIAGFHARMGGLGIFADQPIYEHLRVGASLTYAKTHLKTPEFGYQHTTINSMQLTGYSSVDMDKWFTDAMLGFSYNSFRKLRSINFPGVSRTASAAYRGYQYGGKARAGIIWALDEGVDFMPFVSLQYLRLQQDGFTEKGAGDLGLVVPKRQDDLFQVGVGARVVVQDFTSLDNCIAEFHTIGLRDLKLKNVPLSARFIGSPGTFTVLPPGTASVHTLNIGGSISVMGLENMMITAGYDVDVKKSFMSHSVMLRLRWIF